MINRLLSKSPVMLASITCGLLPIDSSAQIAPLEMVGEIDFTGDGIQDLVVGDRAWEGFQGRVSLYSGVDWSLVRHFESPQGVVAFGASLAVAGDWTGDGVPELASGAGGAVSIFDVTSDAVVATIHAESTSEYSVSSFGSSIAAEQDVNGDGVPDVLVGAPRTDDNNAVIHCDGTEFSAQDTGAVFLFSGATQVVDLLYLSDTDDMRFGATVAILPDLNGNGSPELFAIGPSNAVCESSPTSCTSCYASEQVILDGRTLEGFSETIPVSHRGTWSIDVSNSTLPGEPGVAQIALGSEGNEECCHGGDIYELDQCRIVHVGVSNRGEIIIEQSIIIEGEDRYDQFSRALAFVDDVDGDGLDDLAIGAPFADSQDHSNAGSVSVVSSATGERLWTFHGSELNERFGSAIARTKDIDLDGIADFAASSENSNRVILFSSRTGAPLVVIGPPLPPGKCDQVGDFNGDSVVNAVDIAILLIQWGPTSQPVWDLDNDGWVGGTDLAILLAAWGPCAAGEPDS